MDSERLIKSCETCTVAWKNFKNLSKSELRLVNENRYEATFKPGEIILKQGSPASSAVFLSKGMAKIYIEGRDRKNFILEIVMPSRMIVGPGVHVHACNSYSLAALTIVQTCFISLEIFNQLMKQNAEFAFGMIEDLSVKSYAMQNKLVSLTRKKMPGRIAEAILFFADEVNQSDVFDMILSRQELGEMANMAKESVVRILKELESSGVVKSDGSKIQILDKEKLKMISEFILH
ncbi:MAG: Crp/Fnr family transcriptional regulator [Porphyromonadaceae bacterium]|nr:MAG: Crp/Fnr family transcriptional regulator [Porphyromonadaceae bacterium]